MNLNSYSWFSEGEIFEDIIDTVNYCVENKKLIPALILIYSAIDKMAYLTKDIRKDSHGRKEYIQWTNKYMIKYLKKYNCTGKDIYAGRCGIVHSQKSSSRMNSDNNAKKINYFFDNPNNDKINIKIQKILLTKNVIYLNVNDFVKAFYKAVYDFADNIENDKTLAERVSINSRDGFITY